MKPDESDRLRARYIKSAFGLKKQCFSPSGMNQYCDQIADAGRY